VSRGTQQTTEGKTTNASDPTARYRNYLRSFGIVEAGDRVAELRDLDLGNVRFFAYASSDGLRLKAAVTPDGVVTPGGHPGDQWYGFLSGMPDARSAAERIAWLETDGSTPPHSLPNAPVIALAPDRPPAIGIDPAQWALVTPPVLCEKHAGGGLGLVVWILPSGARVPERWTVTAPMDAPAAIERASAFDLLVPSAGSAGAVEASATERAKRLLNAGVESERLWALDYTGGAGLHGTVPELAALLANVEMSPKVRLLAAATLGRLADSAAVIPLGAAIRADAVPEVRRACAQALGRIPDAGAVQALAEAALDEPDLNVRIEVVHALAAHGSIARATLTRIVHSDPDPAVRDLAQDSLDVIK
jgi:hypothetical protein